MKLFKVKQEIALLSVTVAYSIFLALLRVLRQWLVVWSLGIHVTFNILVVLSIPKLAVMNKFKNVFSAKYYVSHFK